MPSDAARVLAEARLAYLESPAGYGKTHTIAEAVKLCYEAQGKQLILTHTHAGVHSLNAKLQKQGVPRSAYRVETIAGWALKYASAFRKISKLTEDKPRNEGWDAVYPAVLACLKVGVVCDVVRATYGGLFVDEYQDCSLEQHYVIRELATILPCRVLGDPMQAIFGFRGTPVSLTRDLAGFEHIEPLSTPYRWKLSGAHELGEWLHYARVRLSNKEDVSFDAPTVEAVADDYRSLLAKSKKLIGGAGTALVLHEHARQAHGFSRQISGRYRSMEEMDCGDLLNFAESLDRANAEGQAKELLKFVALATSNISVPCKQLSQAISRMGRIDTMRLRTCREVGEALNMVIDGGGASAMSLALRCLLELPDAKIYRHELVREARRCLSAMEEGEYGSFAEAAFHVRNRTRQLGRKLDRFISSRILLVKGLEFDHVVVAACAKITTPELLYVALTRGSVSLAVQFEGASLPCPRARAAAESNSGPSPQLDLPFD